jgi:geranylgeranyl diphosphate synthase type II
MSVHYDRYIHLKSLIDARLATVIERTEPVTMYTPARYVLEAGGKRIRPVLVLLACEAVGGTIEHAVDAGVAVEILHNFTLVHDDIMDNADQRRGRATVHKEWDSNIAILVGDELIGIAYKCLLKTPDGDIREVIDVFTDGMIEVCEGQSYDKEFETRGAVSMDEYLMMIGKKTGQLVTMSAEMGAIIGGATHAQRDALASYAQHVGRAFQIQDDLLDVVADEKEFGKAIGGDIVEGKKTYLLVHALSRAQGSDLELLGRIAAKRDLHAGLVPDVTAVYERLGVLEDAREQIRRDTDAAIGALSALEATQGREMLVWFAEMLLRRNS